MLKTYPHRKDLVGGADDLSDVYWIDLLNPDEAETARVEAAIGAKLPSLGSMSGIAASNRLRDKNGVLFMSTPSAAKHPEGAQATPPLGFVLSQDRLITVRFMPLATFDTVAARFESGQETPSCGLDVFLLLGETIVDHVSDILEALAGKVNALSTEAFHADGTQGRSSAHANLILRGQLRQVGRLGDRISELRDGLQGLARILTYTEQYAADWSHGTLKPRLAALRQDIHSLIDYEEQLANKVQFDLDALVGLIGIVQNDIFRILTIVSIVGIPPTLVAGIYGMNFKNIPEYDWAWGYQFGWAAIILSAIVPLVWFKLKRWF